MWHNKQVAADKSHSIWLWHFSQRQEMVHRATFSTPLVNTLHLWVQQWLLKFFYLLWGVQSKLLLLWSMQSKLETFKWTHYTSSPHTFYFQCALHWHSPYNVIQSNIDGTPAVWRSMDAKRWCCERESEYKLKTPLSSHLLTTIQQLVWDFTSLLCWCYYSSYMRMDKLHWLTRNMLQFKFQEQQEHWNKSFRFIVFLNFLKFCDSYIRESSPKNVFNHLSPQQTFYQKPYGSKKASLFNHPHACCYKLRRWRQSSGWRFQEI